MSAKVAKVRQEEVLAVPRPGRAEERLLARDVTALLPWVAEGLDPERDMPALMARIETVGFEWGVVLLAKMARAGLLPPGTDPGEVLAQLLSSRPLESTPRLIEDPPDNDDGPASSLN